MSSSRSRPLCGRACEITNARPTESFAHCWNCSTSRSRNAPERSTEETMQVVSRALTDDGYGIGTPFKSSRIGKDVGYKALQKYYGMSKDNLKKPGALDRLRQTVKDAMSPHNTRDEFRQLLKAESINTVFRINPVGRVYGVTFIDHTNGIVANGSVLGREFSAGVFNELFPTSRKETLHTAEQHAERQYEQRSRTANPVSGVVDTLLDLVDARAFEEQQRIQRRRRKRKLHR